mgnify:CR=1 FL=1
MRRAYNNLLKNSLIFTLANFGNKLITFIMVPLYTYVLEPEAYGTIDIVTTTSSLVIPIVFMCVSDAVMRYTMSTKYEKEDILTNGIFIYFQGLLITFFAMLLFGRFPIIEQYKWFFFGVLASNGLLLIFNQFLRSIDKVKEFAINGVLYTFSFVSCNIIFLLWLKRGINGYLCSMIIANTICIIYAFIMARAWRYLVKHPSKEVLKIMLKYSVPLIPNSLMWWIMDASDKFVIAYFLGVNANGIYAIAKKLPTIIDTFHGIFNQAWQISAIQENDTDNAIEFTSSIYKTYTILLFCVVSLLMVVSRPMVKYLLAAEYSESWKYIPLLLLSVALSSLSGLLSANFIANEKTGIIFKTTVYGAIINTVLNIVMIPIMGINGAAFATAFSFLVVLLIREQRIIKQGNLLILFKRKTIIIIIILEFIVYYMLSMWVTVGILTLLTVCLIFCYRDTILTIIKSMTEKIKRRGA